VTAVASIVLVLLAVFTLRRGACWLASCVPARPDAAADRFVIALAVVARDEEAALPQCLAALSQLRYPRERLHFVLVSDASTDGTAHLFRQWAARQCGAIVIELPKRLGKGGALQRALQAAPASDLFVSIDADAIAQPDCIARLAGAFEDPRVGLASGYAAPGNAAASWVARYAALERWVYHLVMLAGKDRLRANPPAAGVVCAYRRSTLDALGGFPLGHLAEDVEISGAFIRAGWRTRWMREAVVREDVVASLDAFWAQRHRWSRGLYATAMRARGPEAWLVAAGYCDRLVFVIALVLAAAGAIHWAWLAAYLCAPFAMLLTGLRRSGVRAPLTYLAALPLFALDIATAAYSAWSLVTRRAVAWERAAILPARAESGAPRVPGGVPER